MRRELVNEAALADAWNADERHELRSRARRARVERVPENAELPLAADELRARLVRDVDIPNRARACIASQTAIGSAFPFASTGAASR